MNASSNVPQKASPPAQTKIQQEKRAAIDWFEKGGQKQQEDLIKESTAAEGRRGYVTTNYDLAKKSKKDVVTPESYANQQRALQAIEKTSQYLAVETNITTILEKIAETTATTLGAKQATLWDFTPDKKGAYIIAAYGMQQQYIDHSRKDPLPIGGAWLGRAMATGQAWATSDIQKDPVLPKSWLPAVIEQDYHGLLCVPLMKGSEIIGGMCIYHKDIYEYRFFELNVMTIIANQAATAVANARIFGDLTAEKNKTTSIIYSLNDGLVMYDNDARIILFNPKAQEFLLLGLGDVIGKRIEEASSEKSVYLKNLLNISRLTSRDHEIKEYTTEGPQKLVLRVTQIPVQDSKKQKIGVMHILHDITHEKEVEQLKASFVTTASHQLRTPLAGIKWSLSSFLKEEYGSLNPKQVEVAKKIFDANNHLIRLVNDLLDVSRIEEGRFGYAFVESDLSSIAEPIVESLQTNAQSRGVNLSFEKPSEPLHKVSVDGGKIELAIQNIIDNGVKYTNQKGSVSVSIRTEKDFLVLVVKDTGIGIPQKDQPFIFNKFFRAENAVRYQTEGSGLGLFIANSIVGKHNGTVAFASKEGRGSTFVIRLPIDKNGMPKGKVEGL